MRHYLHNSLRALFLSLAVLLSLPMLAVEIEIDGIRYDLVAETKQAIVIKKSSGTYSGSIVIPESVEHESTTYSVTSIGEWAFSGFSGLTSVTIPNSVTNIGDGAFCYCSGLTSITIPNSVTSIRGGAFNNCSGLTSIVVEEGNAVYDSRNNCNAIIETASNTLHSGCKTTIIPNSVKNLGVGAFSGCSGLTSVTIPNSVTSIGDDAFSFCDALTSVTIPNSVKSIGEEAFDWCSGLTSVTIGNSVTSIGSYAFSFCDALTSVTIPESVTSIGNRAFQYCSGLTSIVVEEGNAVYDSRNNCNAIIETASNTLHSGCKTTIIPDSVKNLGEGAFYGCDSLTSITIPNSVMSIGDDAFYYCESLTSVTIPDSVTSIGNGAFDYCFDLASVTIGNSVKSIGRSAFSSCIRLTSVTIPDSVESIGEYAFDSCHRLTSVTIGNSVESIGKWAFRDCSKLRDVYCYAENVPSTYSDAFDGSYPENATLHVPATSIESYQVTSPWSSFGKIVALTPDETGIDELKGKNGKVNQRSTPEGAEVKSAVYDLSGRRVQKAQKGIFIQNGKVVVK